MKTTKNILIKKIISQKKQSQKKKNKLIEKEIKKYEYYEFISERASKIVDDLIYNNQYLIKEMNKIENKKKTVLKVYKKLLLKRKVIM